MATRATGSDFPNRKRDGAARWHPEGYGASTSPTVRHSRDWGSSVNRFPNPNNSLTRIPFARISR